jgi:hypothetical protein
MKTPRVFVTFVFTVALLNSGLSSAAQDARAASTAVTPLAASAPTAVPSLVPYSGVAIAGDGKPLAGETGVTFQIFKDETGGEALWTETQSVAIDSTGHYKVQLGATSPNGLPTGLFSTGEARWLEVQIAGEPAQPRVLLASVPYALKAGDATTLGGLPASAFALAVAKSESAGVSGQAATPDSVLDVTTTGGTTGYLPEFSGGSTIVNSPVFVSGSYVGIGTATPAQTLDVNGTTVFRSNVYIYHNGTATPTGGVNSVPMVFLTEGYNSSKKAVVAPAFQWKAEVVGNNTAAPSATQNLLYSNGSGSVETGFHFNPDGTMSFALGQTFPGADITGTVNASGYDLGGSRFATGSASAENAYLGFAGNTSSTGVENTGTGYLALNSDTTGTDNTATGALALSNNTIGGYNTATGLVALYGNTTGQSNTADGASTLTDNADGSYNTASGFTALTSNADGSQNTASGAFALYENTTGDDNTAVGAYSLLDNTTGSFLTAVGYDATSSNSPVINNSTALGAYATVGQSNSLILGQTTDGKPGASFVNVGIGTATPRTTLEVAVNAPNALGPVLTLTNSGQGGSAIDFNTSQPAAGSVYAPSARIVAYNNAGSNQIAFESRSGQGMQKNLVVSDDGSVYAPGALDAGAAGLKINHPLDPENKYLVHSSVESSEMMNIYSGNVTTDELGLATVALPAWFEAENTDFRYQLTVIGQFAQAIVKDKVANGQFRIMTNASHVEVSWQITAVRQDAYAKAHPLVVEQLKPEGERAGASHPEFGQPASALDRVFEHPALPEPKAPAMPTPRIHPAVARPAVHVTSAVN